jgi:hypothetical protein
MNTYKKTGGRVAEQFILTSCKLGDEPGHSAVTILRRKLSLFNYAGWIPPTVVCGGNETGGTVPGRALCGVLGCSRL